MGAILPESPPPWLLDLHLRALVAGDTRVQETVTTECESHHAAGGSLRTFVWRPRQVDWWSSGGLLLLPEGVKQAARQH